MPYKKLNRTPIPAEIQEQLSDQKLTRLERVRLGERVRQQYGRSLLEVADLAKIPPTSYSRIMKEIRLPQKVQHSRYPLPKSKVDMIFQTKRFALYRKKGELYLSAAVQGKKRDLTYHLTDNPIIICSLISLMGQNELGILHIDARLFVRNSHGEKCGSVIHHMVSALYGLKLEEIIQFKYRFRKAKPQDMVYDCRLTNVYFPDIDILDTFSPRLIYRTDNEVRIFRETFQQTTVLNFTKSLWQILQTYPVNAECRDHRETVYVKDSKFLLYHLVLADYLYAGLSVEADELIDEMDRFQEEYLGHKEDPDCCEIDHLDGDRLNCRIDNLMIMTPEQNLKKANYQKVLKRDTQHRYVQWRYGNDTVRFRVFSLGNDGSWQLSDDDVESVDEYIVDLWELAETVKLHQKEHEGGLK